MITMTKMLIKSQGWDYVFDRFRNPVMRKFIYLSIGLPLIGIMLSSCGKYESSIEAINACKEWVEEGDEFIFQGVYETYSLDNLKKYGTGLRTEKLSTSYQPIRYCKEDTKTRKYVGITRMTRDCTISCPVRNIKQDEVFEIQCNEGFPDCAINAVFEEVFDEVHIKVEKRFSY